MAWLRQKSGEEDTLDALSSRTTPRPSFSSPAELSNAEKPSKRTFQTSYTTPHDSILADLQAAPTKSGSTDQSSKNAAGLSDTEPTGATLQDPPVASRFGSDALIDPFDGNSLGVLIPHPSSQGSGDSHTPSQVNLLSGTESGGGFTGFNLNESDAVWSRLSRVLEIQSEISKMHLEMETIGQSGLNMGDWQSKRQRPTHKNTPDINRNASTFDDEDLPLPPGPTRPRQRALSTVSTISSASDGDDVGSIGNKRLEDESGSNRRGDDFVKLASQFEKRKTAINDIMSKLGDLSKTLSEFHAVQTPNIEFPASRSSTGVTSPASQTSPLASNLGNPKASSSVGFETNSSRFNDWPSNANLFTKTHRPSLSRSKSDAAAPSTSKRNIPSLVLHTADAGNQAGASFMESPASTLGSLQLAQEE